MRAAIFDFNGTLSMDEPLLDRLFREAFAGIGIAFDSAFYFRELAGRSDPEIVERALRLHGREPDPHTAAAILERKVAGYIAAVRAEPTISPETVAFVRGAAQVGPVAIGSGAIRREIAFQLDLHGIADLFPTIVTIDDVARGKPDPETFLRCLTGIRRFDASIGAADCVVFEDSSHGIAAARAADMRCVAVHSSGDRASLASAEEIVDRLDMALLARLVEG